MIEVFNVNPIHKGDLVASVSVHILPWKFKIHKITVFQKGTQRWVSLPREKYESNGETKYSDLMEITDAGAANRFRAQILEAVDLYEAKNGGFVPEDVIKPEEPFPF